MKEKRMVTKAELSALRVMLLVKQESDNHKSFNKIIFTRPLGVK